MENKKIISRLLNVFLRKNFVRFVTLFSINFLLSFNTAYSFCIDIDPNNPATSNKALCHYEEIESSDLPFCDSEKVVELVKTCSKTNEAGETIETGDCVSDCNLSDCKTKEYYFIRNETENSFDIFKRNPQPNVNCRGYLPYSEEIEPNSDNSSRIVAQNYPVDYKVAPPNETLTPNSVSKKYCSDLKKDGTLEFPNGQSVDNCLLKSCVHLSVEEMFKIQEASVGEFASESEKKVFCDPYQWEKNSLNLYVKPLLENKLKCYSFSLNQLDYIVVDVNQINNKGYCSIHSCSQSDRSLTCPDDSWNIKTPLKNLDEAGIEYLNKYEEKVLGGNSIDTICTFSEISCPYVFAEDRVCTQDEGGNYILDEECDKCSGVDNNLPDSDNCALYKREAQTCNLGRCIKTTDCGVKAYKDENGAYLPDYAFCDIDNIKDDSDKILEKDELDSWFYRPAPSENAFKDILLPADQKTNTRTSEDYLAFNNNHLGLEGLKAYSEALYDEETNPDETQRICMTRNDYQIANGQCGNVGWFAKCTLGRKYFGLYTVAFGKVTSPPMCQTKKSGSGGSIFYDSSSEGGKTKGKARLCNTLSGSCERLSSDAFYIRGTPQVFWEGAKRPADVQIKIDVCMRGRNLTLFNGCGKRECKAVCAFDDCRQACGKDACKSLVIQGNEQCNLNDSAENKKCVSYFAETLGGTPVYRARAVKRGRRVCVIEDSLPIICIGDSSGSAIDDTNKIREESIKGRLTNSSLFDEQNIKLTDINGDRVINDSDIYGEKIFNEYCGSEEASNKNKDRCALNRILKSSEKVPETINISTNLSNLKSFKPYYQWQWIPWDVVQYIGNNQPQGKDNINCQLNRDGTPKGELSECRGYYDEKGKFYGEQQCFIVPLSIAPPNFYRMATAKNTPDLFAPILYIESIQEANSQSFISFKENPNTQVDFFAPKVQIRFGQTLIEDGLSFGEEESPIKEATTEYIAGKETANYKLKKILKVYPEMKAELCLYRVVKDAEGKDVANLLQCVNRAKPMISNFVLKPSDALQYNNSKIEAYFVNTLDTIEHSNFVNLENEPFFESNNFAKSEGYRIYAEKSLCSKLNWECLDNARKLYEEKNKADPDEYLINNLLNFEHNCENFIKPECTKRNGNEKEVIFENSLYTVKDNTVHGDFNEVCITEGFEDYLRDVVAFNNPKGTLGKCILNNDSQMKKTCRYEESILEYCKEGEEDCQDLGRGVFVKKIDCSCEGEKDGYCTNNVPFACLKGGFNGYGILNTKDDKSEDSCVCKLADENFIASNTLISRKETLREAGLCVQIPEPPVCKAVNYRNEFYEYQDGGEGKPLSEIEKDHISNIWRTEQKRFGIIPVAEREEFDLSHAEFISSLVGSRIIGECRGFWKKAKGNVDPVATCTDVGDLNNDGINDSRYILEQNTGCERYKCNDLKEYLPKEDNENESEYNTSYLLLSELNAYNSGTNAGNKQEKTEDDVDPRGRFNGFADWSEITSSDDLEEQIADRCVVGFGPAGANYLLERYIPVIEYNKDSDDSKVVEALETLAERLLGYRAKGEVYYYQNDSMIPDLKDNLPKRYCNQIGEWMPVMDIYNKDGQDLYFVDSENWHTDSDENGVADIAVADEEGNYRFCERLYCPAKNIDDIVELSVENGSSGDKYIFEVGYGIYSYPNVNDINKETFWRHTGGAIWPETSAMRADDMLKQVTGKCENKKGFYTSDTIFWSNFNDQLSALSNEEGENGILDLKNYRLATDSSPQTQPTRFCSSVGLWGLIRNKCVKACEMLNMYNTEQTLDTNQSNSFSKEPDYSKFSEGQLSISGISYGDDITGGAKWARSLPSAGVIEGECDASNPDKDKRYIEDSGIAPTRTCSIDGTWGPIQNKCIKVKTCGEDAMTNANMFNFAEGELRDVKDIIEWTGAEADFTRIVNNVVFANGLCKQEFGFKPASVARGCDLSTGEWLSKPETKCEPITCGAYTDSSVIRGMTKTAPSADEYYVLNTGLDATLNESDTNKYTENNLKGSIFRSDCKEGYIPMNGGVELICKLGGADGLTPVWEKTKNKGCLAPPQCRSFTTLYGTNSTSEENIYLDLLNVSDIAYQGNFVYSKISGCTVSGTEYGVNDIPAVESIGSEDDRTISCYDLAKRTTREYICELENDKAIWKVDGACPYSTLKTFEGTSWEAINTNTQGILSGLKVRGVCGSGYTGLMAGVCKADGTWLYQGGCYKNCTGGWVDHSWAWEKDPNDPIQVHVLFTGTYEHGKIYPSFVDSTKDAWYEGYHGLGSKNWKHKVKFICCNSKFYTSSFEEWYQKCALFGKCYWYQYGSEIHVNDDCLNLNNKYNP